MADEAIFDETQRLHENTIVRFVVPISGLVTVLVAGSVMVSQGASAAGLGLLLVGGLVVPLGLALLPQRTVVSPSELRVRSLVGWGVKIPMADVVSAQAVRYDPIRDCGGWGLRKSKDHGLVLNVSGDRGVQVRYIANGVDKAVLIGSRRSDELEDAIRVAASLSEPAAEHGEAPSFAN